MKNSRRNLEKVARLAEATSGKKPKVSKYALKANPRLVQEYRKAFPQIAKAWPDENA